MHIVGEETIQGIPDSLSVHREIPAPLFCATVSRQPHKMSAPDDKTLRETENKTPSLSSSVSFDASETLARLDLLVTPTSSSTRPPTKTKLDLLSDFDKFGTIETGTIDLKANSKDTKEQDSLDSAPSANEERGNGNATGHASSASRRAFGLLLAGLIGAALASLITWAATRYTPPCSPQATVTATVTERVNVTATVLQTVTVPAPVLHSLVENPVRIIALGDSITAGLMYGGHYRSMMSYPRRLQERLNLNEKGWGRGFEVKIEGKGGDRVVDGFYDRLDFQLKLREKEGEKYEWLIILGGINDLIHGSSSSEIIPALQKLWDRGLKHNRYLKVLQGTVMESGPSIGNYDSVEQRRLQLNKDIVTAAGKRERVYVIDTAKVFPMRSLGEGDHKERWDDDLHPTSKGYEILGDVFYEGIRGLLN